MTISLFLLLLLTEGNLWNTHTHTHTHMCTVHTVSTFITSVETATMVVSLHHVITTVISDHRLPPYPTLTSPTLTSLTFPLHPTSACVVIIAHGISAIAMFRSLSWDMRHQ